MDNFVVSFSDSFSDNFRDNFRYDFVDNSEDNLRTTKLTSYNRTHSLYQHISGIKYGHDESGPRKPYDISCATLRTFNINICVSLLLFVHPTLNAGLVDPFCRAPAPKKQNRYVFINSKRWHNLIVTKSFQDKDQLGVDFSKKSVKTIIFLTDFHTVCQNVPKSDFQIHFQCQNHPILFDFYSLNNFSSGKTFFDNFYF